jgi:hypothetical protein
MSMHVAKHLRKRTKIVSIIAETQVWLRRSMKECWIRTSRKIAVVELSGWDRYKLRRSTGTMDDISCSAEDLPSSLSLRYNPTYLAKVKITPQEQIFGVGSEICLRNCTSHEKSNSTFDFKKRV